MGRDKEKDVSAALIRTETSLYPVLSTVCQTVEMKLHEKLRGEMG